MKPNFLITLFLTSCLAIGFLQACGSSGGSSNDPSAPIIPLINGKTIPAVSGANVLRMSISSTTDCGASTNYMNKPCVTLTVCNANGSNCNSINDILVDTGSYGLRVFKSALGSTAPTQITTGGKNVAQCVEYGDGSKQWGPVASAQVKLGGEPAVTIPIQVIDSTFVGMSAKCSGADTSPTTGGLNGILGVGAFEQDCGVGCTVNANNGYYYACDSTTCTGTTLALSNQVTNPVAALPQDNNGVILMLPDLDVGGEVSSSGYLVLGIGTQANNTPSSVTRYSVNPNNGEFTTVFNGKTYNSFLDSGSNALYFPTPGSSVLPDCGSVLNSNYAGWYCPSSLATLSAVNHAYGNTTEGSIAFQIENFATFLNSPNYAIKEIGGNSGGNLNSLFDWGLSFHFGRNVVVGFENKSSGLGNGPYWAY